MMGRHDIRHNDTLQNDTRHTDALNNIWHNDTQLEDIQHKYTQSLMTFCIKTLRLKVKKPSAEWRYAECRRAKSLDANDWIILQKMILAFGWAKPKLWFPPKLSMALFTFLNILLKETVETRQMAPTVEFSESLTRYKTWVII